MSNEGMKNKNQAAKGNIKLKDIGGNMALYMTPEGKVIADDLPATDSGKANEGKIRRTFKVQMFLGDMGSYTTNAHSWEDLLWDVNSARDHDGLPHLDLEQLKNCNPKITEIH